MRAEVEERNRRLEQDKQLTGEVEAERKRRQELEIQLAKGGQGCPFVAVAATVPRNLNALAEHLNLF